MSAGPGRGAGSGDSQAGDPGEDDDPWPEDGWPEDSWPEDGGIDAYESEGARTRALVLHPDIRARHERHLPERALAEAVGLARALPSLDVVGGEVVRLGRAVPATLFGAGKVDELKARIAGEDIGLVLVDGPVSPVQQRNLE